jgi:hypothetical protein
VIETLTELQLLDDIASRAHDPLKFVAYCYPWGQGVIEGYSGSYPWQAEVLRARDHLRNPETRFHPCRIAVS